MTSQLTPLQCPGCGGLLRSLDARVWECAYCESRYMLLGEETPVPGLTRVVDGSKASLYLYDDCWPEVTEDVARARFEKYLDVQLKLNQSRFKERTGMPAHKFVPFAKWKQAFGYAGR